MPKHPYHMANELQLNYESVLKNSENVFIRFQTVFFANLLTLLIKCFEILTNR